MGIMFAYAALSYLRLKISVKEAIKLEDNVWLCDKMCSPFILGFFKPQIYLPSDMESEQLLPVLAHERAHIKRLDHLWKLLGYLLLTVYWFYPLVWIAYALLCRDIELACDERVVKTLDRDGRAKYSQALLDLSTSRKKLSMCPLAFGEVGVRCRIKSVLNYKKPALWLIALAVIICVAVAACFLTDPVEKKREAYMPPVEKTDALDIQYMELTHGWYEDAGPMTEVAYTDSETTVANFKAVLDYENIEFSEDVLKLEPEEYYSVRVNDKQRLMFNTELMDGKTYMDVLENGTIIKSAYLEPEILDYLQSFFTEKEAPEPAQNIYKNSLDTAISEALLKKNRSSAPYAVPTESHIILAEENSGGSQTTVYIMYLYHEFGYAGEKLHPASGISGYAALTFDEDPDGVFILSEYWTPRSGELYYSDIKEKFPEGTELDKDFHSIALMQSCYAQAVGLCKVDTDNVIEELFSNIASFPAEQSSPSAYIDAHPAEYRELIYYGEYTLRYIFEKFLKGGQTGLQGHLMHIVLDDISGEGIRLSVETGQEYFDEWLSSGKDIYRVHGTEYLRENMPASYLALSMAGEIN